MSKKNGHGFLGGIVVAVLVVGGLLIVSSRIEKIKPGYVGIVYSVNGGINGEVLDRGWHFVSPGKKVTQYSIALEQSYLTSEKKGDSPNDDSFQVPTSDGKQVIVSLEFSYSFDEGMIAETFERFKGQSGEEIKDTFIKDKVKSWTREVTSKYPVTDLFGDQITEINAELDEHLREKFAPYGIIIDTINFTDTQVDAETSAAIQKKVNAQQEQELASIEAKTAKINAEKEKEVALIEAEKDKETAQIQAEQATIKAQGQADATRIKAEAEAEAVSKVAGAMTQEYIDYTKAQAWNGELPTVQGSAGTIVDIGDMGVTGE